MTPEDIRAWLSLCRAARKLPVRQWETWCFMVGSSGVLSDRICLGQAALATFGRFWSFTPGKGAADER